MTAIWRIDLPQHRVIEAAMSDAHTPIAVPDVLDGSMTANEIAEVLQGLRFRGSRMVVIEIDRHVARYLAGLIRPRQRHAA